MKREQALTEIVKSMSNFPMVSSTGKISREIYEIRENNSLPQNGFLVTGALGLTASIGAGVAMASGKRIVVVDGDGSLLMHLGSLATIGQFQPDIIHFLIDNQSHDSTGGQPTATPNWREVFEGCSYNYAININSLSGLKTEISYMVEKGENLITPVSVIVQVEKGSREDLGRPKHKPEQIKQNFMELFK